MKTDMKKICLAAFAAIITLTLFVNADQKPLTIYMAGDSTMADREDTIETPERGWGQVLPTFLNDNVIVKNYAKNGRSSRSFIEEGRWSEIVNQLQKGDVVIIQFGHNDTKQTDSVRHTSIEQYQANLESMIKQAQKKKAKPILCTPITRRAFSMETGELINKHGGYVEAARRVAKATKVPLVDLNQTTSDWLTQVGDSASQPYFVYKMEPGEYSKYPEGKTDNTHLRELGALVVASMFAEAVESQKIKPLNKYINIPQGNNLTPVYTTVYLPVDDSENQ